MPTTYTIDASVFLNAFNPYESGYAESRRVLEQLRGDEASLTLPTLLLPEVACAISRGRQDAILARSFASALARWPNVTWMPLDELLAAESADIGATYRLRGSDAVYAAVALRSNSMLITLDREQRERLEPALSVRYPHEIQANEGES